MTYNNHYTAFLAERSAVPTLLCGHCHSILSRSRMFKNQGDNPQNTECDILALCFADDCGAMNCCDDALARIDNPERMFAIAC